VDLGLFEHDGQMEEFTNNKLGCSSKKSGSKQHLGIQTAKHGILTNTKFAFQKRSMRISLATKQEGLDGLLIRIDMVIRFYMCLF